MALVYTQQINNAIRRWKFEGLLLANVEVTIQTSDVPAGGGIPIVFPNHPVAANRAVCPFGMHSVFDIFGITIRPTGNAIVRGILCLWDPLNGRIRFFGPTATGNTLTELVSGAGLGNGDVVRFTAIGV